AAPCRNASPSSWCPSRSCWAWSCESRRWPVSRQRQGTAAPLRPRGGRRGRGGGGEPVVDLAQPLAFARLGGQAGPHRGAGQLGQCGVVQTMVLTGDAVLVGEAGDEEQRVVSAERDLRAGLV